MRTAMEVETRGPTDAESEPATPKDDKALIEGTYEDAEGRDDAWSNLWDADPKLAVALFLWMLGGVGLPTLVFVCAFAGMGWGEQVLTHVRSNNEESTTERLGHGEVLFETLGGTIVAGGALILMCLYLLDAEYWVHPQMIRARTISLGVVVVCVVTAMVLLGSEYPFGPLCLLLIGLPWVQYMSYKGVMRLSPSWLGSPFPTGFRDYLVFLTLPLLIVACITLGTWIGWVNHKKNTWDESKKTEYAHRAGCPDPDDCLAGFILWLAPLLCSAVLLFFAGFTHAFRPGQHKAEYKMLGAAVALVCLALWVASSLAGVSKGLTAAIFFFALASLVAVCITLSTAVEGGFDRLLKEMHKKSEEATSSIDPDWLRATFVITCAPLVILFLPVSALNQAVRKCRCFACAKALDHGSGEDRLWFTQEMQSRLERAWQWNWTSVLRKVLWLGIAYQTLSVIVSKFTVLFLAWLNEAVSDWSLLAVIAITVGVGLCLFLLPPVPGAPIYVTAGILIPATSAGELDEVSAVLLAMLVSLCTKLAACFLQQVAIGGQLADKVWIRQICMVNTPMIKCFRLILQERCLTLSKVGVLVGGPDWPTSVLCGILRIPLLQTIVGTVPAIGLIAPCVLTGSFYYYGNTYPVYATLAVIAGMVGGGVQSGSLVVAGFYVEKILRERRDEVDAIPDDEEVREADERDAKRIKRLNESTHWQEMHKYPGMRVLLSVSACLMVISCYLVTVYPSSCFRQFELTDTIEERLGGDAFTLSGNRGLTMPLGNVALLFFFISIAGLVRFRGLANRVAKESGASVEDDAPPKSKSPLHTENTP